MFEKYDADGLFDEVFTGAGEPRTHYSALVNRLEKDYGLRLAGGQDTLKGKIIRLAHMGHIDAFDVLAALSDQLNLPLVAIEGPPPRPRKKPTS